MAAQPAPKPRILIVDDDDAQRSLLDSFLRAQGYETLTAGSGEHALEALRSQPVDMMISDVRMPGLSGLETLREARRDRAHLPVLLVTAYTDIRDAVHAMRDGAVNYLAKPIDLDELLQNVQQATGTSQSRALHHQRPPLPANVIAESPIMQSLFADVSLIAPSESRVLITGESGVGKEVLADVIHAWSPRSSSPLVKVNCAAIPAALLESELFGHERGAFTSATNRRVGRFEAADGGTLFLDEIGDLAPELQAKLLRVTQDGKVQRVGSNKEIHTDVRILAASNRDLEQEVRDGRFREDLFYRLNVVELSLPPLRERAEDILPLARLFINEFSRGRSRFSAAVADRLTRYAWPGNVRELRNAMERAALLSQGDVVLPEHLPNRVKEAKGPSATAEAPAGEAHKLEEVERQAILDALQRNQFNRTETAAALGISRRTLIYKLQRLRELGYPVDPP